MAQSGKLYSPDAIKVTVFYFLFSGEEMTSKNLQRFARNNNLKKEDKLVSANYTFLQNSF